MALSMTGMAFGAVIVAAVTLYTIGPPGGRATVAASAAPTTTGAPQPGPSIAAADGMTLHSVSADFPSSDRIFPGGDAASAINNNCLACHSAGMVLNQPRLSRAAWQAEVEKMRGTYKAPVAAADIPAIVDYLAKTEGPN